MLSHNVRLLKLYHILRSTIETMQYASLRGENLHGVHPTRSQFSAVCITQRNQSPQCVSKMLLDAFKGTIRRNPFRGEHIHHERKALKHKKWVYSTKSKILTLLCYAHCRGNIFEHGNQISQRNQNRIRKYVSLFYQVPGWVRIMKKMVVKNLVTHSF